MEFQYIEDGERLSLSESRFKQRNIHSTTTEDGANWQSNGDAAATEIGGMNVNASTSGWTIAIDGGAVKITAN